jgi:Ca2+-binding EF-hand superfamily protein
MRRAIIAVELVGLLGLLLVAGDAFPQPGPGGPGGPRGPGGGGGRDPGALFDRFAGPGATTVNIAQLPFWFQASITKYAQDHGITNGQITRDQFTAAFQEMRAQRQGGGAPGAKAPGQAGPGGPGPGGPGPLRFRLPPGWQPPGQGGGRPGQNGADREFRTYDLNRDGFLTKDEIPGALFDELMRFDTDEDGKISLQEFEQYVAARERGEAGPRPGEEGASQEEPEQRPVVFRAGKLPKELPPWFKQYDTDGDGQVSLYEWRMAGEPLQKFAQMDRNDDGFLTAEEVLQFEKVAKAKGKNGPAGTQVASAGTESEADGQAGPPAWQGGGQGAGQWQGRFRGQGRGQGRRNRGMGQNAPSGE